MRPRTLVPVTHFPIATQRVFERNARRIREKPYARFFDGHMYLDAAVLPAATEPMDAAHVLPVDATASLLDDGHHEVENGWCVLPGGGAYVASRTEFPGCTLDMFRWWFWWHSFEPERYTLWYPWNHVTVRRDDPRTATARNLTHEQRLIGSTHRIREFIGPYRQDIAIHFRDVTEYGVPHLPATVAQACGDIWLRFPRLRVGTMVHLARETDEGLELRSRYWLGDRVELPLGGERSLGLTTAGDLTGIKRLAIGRRLGYEQFLHDQTEFTHLAEFLPRLYAEFGS